jgi:arylsulfatase A-like enzyme
VQFSFNVVKRSAHCLRKQSVHVSGRLRQVLAVAVAFIFAFSPAAQLFTPAPVQAKGMPAPAPSPINSSGDCELQSAHGEIRHVIYIQFDNVHFTRDNPNVPSDLEQMPNLLNFITNNGVLMTNHHTPLKSHTADDIITSLTGVYPDRHGMPISNSFGWFTPPGSKFFDGFASSFQYWTDIVNATTDPSFFMITPDGKNAPAPWVPWTRAGCNVGAASIANMELENVAGDLQSVFGSDPAELAAALAEVKANRNQAIADFEGIAIHCAAGNAVCSSANHGEPDILPQEPGGYSGFNALYGHKFVAPVISPNGPLTDLDGNLVQDTHGNPGFPGFSGISAAQTLSYVAAMQEHGVPVTYAYISDAHDNHTRDIASAPAACATDPELAFGTANGPGSVCNVAQLAAYNEAFGKFFARLAADGINKHNTLFVITADEGDHYAGGSPFNAGCDGVTVACRYINPATNTSVVGEFDTNLTGLMATEQGITATFDSQFDMVPVFYIAGNPPVGDPLARSFERAAANLTAVNPLTGNTDNLTEALADPVELKLLHMVTGDPQRTPSFVMFGDPDYFHLTGAQNCNSPCVFQSAGFAWNHGGIDKEIVTTFLGLVGPGVKNKGVDDDVWSDHVDIRPTMLVLTGLKDDYQSEGRALVEELHHWAIPDAIRDSGDEFVELARAFKKINAPNAELGQLSLRISTKALASGSPGSDSTYIQLENDLSNITTLRDTIAADMLNRLEDAEFNGKRISGEKERQLTREAEGLLDIVEGLAHPDKD